MAEFWLINHQACTSLIPPPIIRQISVGVGVLTLMSLGVHLMAMTDDGMMDELILGDH